MTRKGRGLSREERELWDGVTRSIVPLRKRRAKLGEQATEEAPKRATAASITLRRTTTAVAAAVKQPSLAPLDRKLKQRLKRGRESVDARIDLHGDTQAEAHLRLQRFLRASQDKGAAMVLVITGKGRGPGREGVLKRQVPLWLALPELRDYVLGFDIASVAHGGEGALYVRLRKKRRAD